MSATEEGTTSRDASVGQVDMKLEIQVIPVSDVDRSKELPTPSGARQKHLGHLQHGIRSSTE